MKDNQINLNKNRKRHFWGIDVDKLIMAKLYLKLG